MRNRIEALIQTFEIVTDRKFLSEVRASLREAQRGNGRSIKEILPDLSGE